jgi:hypothetical protein
VNDDLSLPSDKLPLLRASKAAVRTRVLADLKMHAIYILLPLRVSSSLCHERRVGHILGTTNRRFLHSSSFITRLLPQDLSRGLPYSDILPTDFRNHLFRKGKIARLPERIGSSSCPMKDRSLHLQVLIPNDLPKAHGRCTSILELHALQLHTQRSVPAPKNTHLQTRDYLGATGGECEDRGSTGSTEAGASPALAPIATAANR